MGRDTQPKADIGTNFGQAENETEAKYQTTLCLLHQAETEAKHQAKLKAKDQDEAKTGIGPNYQAKAKANDQDEAKHQSHQADDKTPTGRLVKNLVDKKETKAKHQANDNKNL